MCLFGASSSNGDTMCSAAMILNDLVAEMVESFNVRLGIELGAPNIFFHIQVAWVHIVDDDRRKLYRICVCYLSTVWNLSIMVTVLAGHLLDNSQGFRSQGDL